MADSNPRSSMRCHHCAGPLSKEMETSAWTVPPFIRDSFSMIGSAVGGITSAFYGFNHVMPIIRMRVKGPMWFHFLIGAVTVIVCVGHLDFWVKHDYPVLKLKDLADMAPPVIVFSSACAGLAGGAIPALAQLASSSYHAAVSSPSLPPPPVPDDKMHKSRTSSTL